MIGIYPYHGEGDKGGEVDRLEGTFAFWVSLCYISITEFNKLTARGA